ncbi:hypothetical protein HOY82DRAFT_509950 [Tuber indicum]|nr:hypothetical protein HOY82DRAFT_509950 [Tuber indicum]
MLLRYALDVAPLWNTSEEFTEALNLLSPATQARVTKYHFTADRKLALGSQLLQRLVISEIHSGGKPSASIPDLSSIPIVKDEKSGRPFYSPPPATEGQIWELKDYNVSHHNSRNPSLPCLVILVARVAPPSTGRRRVGADIVPDAYNRSESAQMFLEGFRSSGVFTDYEIGVIFSPLRNDEKVKMLYLHWALKEAYVKAVGTGLVTNLLAIEFRGVNLHDTEDGTYEGVEVYIDGEKRPEWKLEVGRLSRGHYFAVAIDGGDGGEEDPGEWKWIEFRKDIWDVWGESVVN